MPRFFRFSTSDRLGSPNLAVEIDLMQSQAVQSYAAHCAGAPLESWRYEPTALGPTEVDVIITHCGICHTDLHLIDNDLGVSSYRTRS
jgi:hypothetical protein